MTIPSPATCETYAAILLKPRRVEFKPGVWHLQPAGEICEAAAAALRQAHSARETAIEECAASLAEWYPDNVNTNAFCAAIRSLKARS